MTWCPLAPLHNPGAVAGIEAARAQFDVPHVAVFDTAFFATLPPAAATYAIPRELAQTYRIRRYGFHGTSHQFVSRAVAELVGRPLSELNQIVLHLGNGCSASAVRGGVAVETSMGLTPLQGLVMGTRSGDVDPGLHTFLHNELGLSIAEIDTLLNKQSGLKGLAGVNDFRALEELRAAGDADAQLAFEVYVHRLKHYVGAYLALLGGVDVHHLHRRGRGEQPGPARRRPRRAGRSGHRGRPRPQRGPVERGPGDLPRRLADRRRCRADQRGAGHRPPDRRPAPRALRPLKVFVDFPPELSWMHEEFSALRVSAWQLR